MIEPIREQPQNTLETVGPAPRKSDGSNRQWILLTKLLSDALPAREAGGGHWFPPPSKSAQTEHRSEVETLLSRDVASRQLGLRD